MFILSTLTQSLITAGIVIVVVLFILFHRSYIESHKEDIKPRVVAIIYTLLFILLAGAIVSILWLWGYDVTDYLINILVQLRLLLENSISRLIGTLITLFIGLGIFKVIKIALFRFSKKAGEKEHRKQTVAKVTLSITKYIIGIGLILALLTIWGINVLPAIAGLGIAGLVIGLGAQKFINDLISGFFIIFENQFDVGDWVQIDGFMGQVVDIGLKTTQVKNFKGELRIFNNGSIDPVSNFNRFDSLAIVDFGIAYKEDVAAAINVLMKELPALRQEQPNMLEDPRVLGVTDLANSSVNLRVVCLVRPMEQWGIERAMRQRIKEILVNNKIEIPFPQVVVHDAHRAEKKTEATQSKENQ